jgi:hypothetical protein
MHGQLNSRDEMQSWPEYLDDAVMKQLQFQRTLRLGQLES